MGVHPRARSYNRCAAVKKTEAKAQFGTWLAQWRCLPDQRGVQSQDLDIDRFLRWLREAHPEALQFRSTMGASNDLESWFAHATDQGWKY